MNVVEMKTAAREEIVTQILPLFPEAVQIGSGEYAVQSSQTDANGKPMYVTFKVTTKNSVDTKVAPAFNPEKAHEAYVEKAGKAKERESNRATASAQNKAKADEKKKATAEKEAAYLQAVKEYMTTVTEIAPMKASEIKANIPELADATVMYVGTLMKKAVEAGYANLVVVDKSNCYHG